MTQLEARYSAVASMTPEQVRQAGMQALARALGPAGLIRFLQQFERGSGDYSRDRHALLDDQGLDDIVARIRDSRGKIPSNSGPGLG